MTRVLIASVGQRDLQRRNEAGVPEPLSKARLREESEQMLNALDVWKARLEFPMIMAVLRTLAAEEEGKESPVQVVLLGTDQEDARYRGGDTIYCARIIKQLLPDQVKKELKVSLEPIKVILLRRQPNRYDQMWEEIENLMRKAKFPGEEAQVYVLMAGGTPAQNMGLLQAAVQRFGSWVQALTVDEQAGYALPLRVGHKLTRAFEDEKLKAALALWDFPAARAVLPDGSPATECAEAAVARLNLDFTRSLTLLKQQLGRMPQAVCGAWDERMNDAQAQALADSIPGSWGVRMREVYWNA